jgi:hypothetical protein
VADPKRPARQTGRSDEPVDRSKRSFFEILFRPVRAAVKGYALPVDHSSANPPSSVRVIRGNANAQVMAMLGPLARGEAAPAGYRLFQVQVATDRIDYVFDKAGDRVRIRLDALDGTEGTTFGESATFRFVVDGSAPIAERLLVGQRVLHEVRLRDRGQLWVAASDAPAAPAATAAGDAAPHKSDAAPHQDDAAPHNSDAAPHQDDAAPHKSRG